VINPSILSLHSILPLEHRLQCLLSFGGQLLLLSLSDQSNACTPTHPSSSSIPSIPLLAEIMPIRLRNLTMSSMSGSHPLQIPSSALCLQMEHDRLMSFRYEKFFHGANDKFEVQRGLNNVFAYDLVPSVKVCESALRACRRGTVLSCKPTLS
jgi:hypothetical protein